jgi:hypothetical protein
MNMKSPDPGMEHCRQSVSCSAPPSERHGVAVSGSIFFDKQLELVDLELVNLKEFWSTSECEHSCACLPYKT